MRLTPCPSEKDVCGLIARGQWPAACSPELREHVRTCRTCADLALVLEAFQQARTESAAAARPLPPALLVWRAQLRRRNAAMKRIRRPLVGAQIFALAAILAATLGVAGLEVGRGGNWLSPSFWHAALDRLSQTALEQWESLWPGASTASGWAWILPAIAAATLVLLGGVAVYVASDRG